MKKCPLCQKLLRNLEDTCYLGDEYIGQFKCQTKVHIIQYFADEHYICNYPFFDDKSHLIYNALVPPFSLSFNLNKMTVCKFSGNTLSSYSESIIYQQDNATIDDFIRLCLRYQNLKVFS